MGARSWELITPDEPTVVTEPLFDAVVVEDGEGNRRFPNPSCTDKGDWNEGFCEASNLLDQFIPPKARPWSWGWEFARRGAAQREILDPIALKVANLG